MRFIFRGVVLGLLAGALFFFVPFFIGFIFFVLFIGFLIRTSFGWGWRGRRYFGWHHRRYYDTYETDTISIDGRGYVPPVKGSGTETRFTVK